MKRLVAGRWTVWYRRQHSYRSWLWCRGGPLGRPDWWEVSVPFLGALGATRKEAK